MFKENMSFRDVEDYILEIPKFTKKNQMETTRAFYEFLGRPGETSRIVHVAGTNGKGSVCAFLESILMNAGHSCGFFSSPHLVSMRERMRIGRADISEKDFQGVFLTVMKKCEEFSGYHGEQYHPTFFEILFFMAMLWFEKKRPEYIILETGLGGRLDTTNVTDQKALCVITGIALEHTEYLGDTLWDIAGEKAGIIRGGVPLVYLDDGGDAGRRIAREAERLGTPVTVFQKKQVEKLKKHEKFIDFSILFEYYGYSDITVSSGAFYQSVNAGLALRAGERLLGDEMTPEIARKAIRETLWPCRMEEVLEDVFVDGAHNPDGVKAFAESVKAMAGEKVLLFSVVSDKNYEEMIDILTKENLFETIIITCIGGSRKADADELKRLFEAGSNAEILVVEDAKEAFCKAMGDREGRLLFVAGSLYLAGLVKGLCEEEFK